MCRQRLLFILISLFILSCGNSNSSDPNPEITGIQPTSGPVGTAVTISGSGFSAQASENSVEFHGTIATVSSASESELVATVPDGATSGTISVTVGSSTVTGPKFTVEEAAPGIRSVAPDSGVVGTEITITGMNFSATSSENTITFNGTSAAITSASETKLVTNVPQGASDGPIEVTVEQNSTTGPNFDVITDGTFEVITETTGSDLDNDGYSVVLDGDNGTSIGINDTLYYQDLEAGSYPLELTGVADNCSLNGSNPRTTDITAGDTTSVNFNISCVQHTKTEKIVFYSDRDGDHEIFVMNPDGTSPQKLTDNTSSDWHPRISNDGSKIAFISRRASRYGNVYIMDIDGANVRQLTTVSSRKAYPSWSPDDSKILFSDDRNGNYEIFSITTDGNSLVQITDNGGYDKYSPAMSPDGNKIAFQRSNTSTPHIAHIYTTNADGSDLQKLTNTNDNQNISNRSPSWAPDGSRIAFQSDSDGNDEIYTMKPDGSGILRITNNPEYDSSPTWSPDGTELLFDSERDGNYEIYKVSADGSGTPVNLSTNSADDENPHWN